MFIHVDKLIFIYLFHISIYGAFIPAEEPPVHIYVSTLQSSLPSPVSCHSIPC